MSCWPWQNPLPKPKKIWQDTYTRPNYGSMLSSSLRGGVPMFKSNEGTTWQNTSKFKLLPETVMTQVDAFWQSITLPSLHARAHQWWDWSITPRGLPPPYSRDDSHLQLRDSDRFTGLFNHAPRWWADVNNVAQTQSFNNPPPIPSAPQASGSASQLPLTTNIMNPPVASPSISHDTFPPAPLNHHHFGFYPAYMLQNHHSTHYPPPYPPLHPLSNEHPPSQPASTTLDHTQFYNSFHPNSQ